MQRALLARLMAGDSGAAAASPAQRESGGNSDSDTEDGSIASSGGGSVGAESDPESIDDLIDSLPVADGDLAAQQAAGPARRKNAEKPSAAAARAEAPASSEAASQACC